MAENAQKHPVSGDHRPLKRVMLVLLVAGLVISGWRYIAKPEAAAAPGDHSWDVELSIRAGAVAGKTSVEIAAPLNTRHLRIVGQNIAHPGWRQAFRLQQGPEASRRIAFVASRDGGLAIDAVFSILALAVPKLGTEASMRPLEDEQRELFLRDHPTLQIDHPEVTSLVAELSSAVEEDGLLADAIFDKVRALKDRTAESLLDVPDILSGMRANSLERAYAMVALCRAARIPARLVKGFVLRESAKASLHFWAEVHQNGRWTPYDPVFGYRHALPSNYLPFVKGLGDLVHVSGTASYAVEYAIVNTDALLELAATTREDWREVFDLTRLSLDTRIVLAALMLLPFGALLTAVFNEVVGIRTYGVFTPTLLALALVYVPWQSAAMVLCVVLVLGVIGRAAIPGELPRVPRLSVILTLVAFGIAASASLMDQFEIGFGGQLVLLPIVILASLVDRFYTVLDEKGLHTALYRLGWTLFLAIACMPIVQFESLGHVMVAYPELHLVTVAAMLGLSLYRGRRLSQLPGFAWLNWPEKPRAVPNRQ